MNDVSSIRLLEAWQQCEWHLYHLMHALLALVPFLPVTPSSTEGMDYEVDQDLSPFILRCTKLQDAMGVRLYSALLDYMQEPYQDRPMVNQLHRLESLSYQSSVEDLNVLRAIRNTFAHDYPQDDEALKAAYMNKAVAAVPVFEKLLARVSPVIECIR